jgi:hypothetical protein
MLQEFHRFDARKGHLLFLSIHIASPKDAMNPKSCEYALERAAHFVEIFFEMIPIEHLPAALRGREFAE